MDAVRKCQSCQNCQKYVNCSVSLKEMAKVLVKYSMRAIFSVMRDALIVKEITMISVVTGEHFIKEPLKKGIELHLEFL